jgi:hypothetical protein
MVGGESAVEVSRRPNIEYDVFGGQEGYEITKKLDCASFDPTLERPLGSSCLWAPTSKQL